MSWSLNPNAAAAGMTDDEWEREYHDAHLPPTADDVGDQEAFEFGGSGEDRYPRNFAKYLEWLGKHMVD